MRKPAIAEHLTDDEYRNLTTTYAAHNSSIGLKYRADYNFGEIIKIKRNIPEKCFEVYYKNGEWFKYFLDGTWG